jgi:hypothetical protein
MWPSKSPIERRLTRQCAADEALAQAQREAIASSSRAMPLAESINETYRRLERRVAALEETHSKWLSEHERRLIYLETTLAVNDLTPGPKASETTLTEWKGVSPVTEAIQAPTTSVREIAGSCNLTAQLGKDSSSEPRAGHGTKSV